MTTEATGVKPEVPKVTHPSTEPAEVKRDENVPIGNVSDALKSTIKTIDAPKEDEHEKREEKTDKKKKQPIESLAALKYHHNIQGTAPTTEEVDEVRELENKIATEGGKKLRTNSIEKGK